LNEGYKAIRSCNGLGQEGLKIILQKNSKKQNKREETTIQVERKDGPKGETIN
jgi:hypothetical protein